MARRPGMAALAAAAGVSVATVDRALNGREQVAADTRTRIAEAAQRIGHPAAWRLHGSGPAPGRTLRFGVVLHKQGQDFYRAFAQELERAIAEIPGLRGELVLEFSASQAPSDMAASLRAMAGRCDVLAATAVNHPEITAAVEELRGTGLPVIALLSDFALGLRAGYLGLDNLKIGRSAGWITALSARATGAAQGKVMLVVGGHRWHGHELREAGFRSYLREIAPGLEVLPTFVNLETRQLTQDAVRVALARHPDLRGIYVAGGGMEGAIAALRAHRGPGAVSLVVSALTPESRRGLADGIVTMVTDTPLERLCRQLFGQMARLVQDNADFGEIFLLPEIHIGESI